ncbi:sensor histidine kinase [Methanocella sp. MCL-LM]|uniref:sensor histidine kinase n=1 Tax=Methanocella sp. MCL-LM TaxID=3412035 RepID=UPI003C795478
MKKLNCTAAYMAAVWPRHQYFLTTIEDNGCGIPDDRKTAIFEQLKRGRTKAKGNGLGLFIVRTLVESFGGSVYVVDRVPGDYTKGSKFIVTLPAADD